MPSAPPIEDDDTPTKSGDKGKRPAWYDSSDEEDNEFHPAKGPLTPVGIPSASRIIAPQEIDVLLAGIEHIATLAHADHPTDKTTYLRPHLTTIELAVQEGLPISHYPPRMTTQQTEQPWEEETNKPQVNVTAAKYEPMPAVQPKEDNGTLGGKALISPPKVFTGDRSKADNFLQDFKLCWRLNQGHPAMKVLYNQVMLALSYMWGNMAIRNWVWHMINTIDRMVSMARFSPVSVNSEQLWGEFQVEFKTTFTNTTKLQDMEAALKHIRIQQGESINQYIAHFEDLIDKAGWLERDCSTINTFWWGLHKPMQKAIFMKDPIPTMFTAWKEAACKEASCYALMKSMGMFQKWDHKTSFMFSNLKAQ